jgi:hypothetical protein
MSSLKVLVVLSDGSVFDTIPDLGERNLDQPFERSSFIAEVMDSTRRAQVIDRVRREGATGVVPRALSCDRHGYGEHSCPPRSEKAAS